MIQSLFPKWVDANFKVLATKIVNKINGTTNPVTYMFKSMLRKNFSTSLKWGSVSSNGTIIRADVVALDSSLPLKRRDSVQTANGDIPKIGMKMYLNETTMNDIKILVATGGQDAEVLRKLFGDMNKCISGIYEELEFMFLQGLSTGVALITGDDTPGLGIRVDYGHPAENKYGVATVWSDVNAKPLDDINDIMAKARLNGDNISYLFMDRNTWNLFKANTQVKNEWAFSVGFVGATIPNVPTLEIANGFLQSAYGFQITVIDRQMFVEKNGKRSVTTPWAANIVCFLTDLNVGTLTYGSLAEETFPVKQVDYTKVDDYILLSKYGKNDPVREFTSSQALVLPVIDNITSVYLMDTNEADASTQTEGDANFSYKSVNYTKASVAAALKLADPTTTLTVSSTDAAIQKAINKLNAAQIVTFEANIVAA